MADLDEAEDPKAGAPAAGQGEADEIETGAEGEQPEAETESLEDKVARLEQALADERRRKKQSQRVTVKQQAELDELRSAVGYLVTDRQQQRLSEVTSSARSRAAAAEAQLEAAHEAGDPKAIAAAQAELTKAQIEAARLEAAGGEDERYAARQPQQPSRAQPQQDAVPPAAKAWTSKHAWYGNGDDRAAKMDSMAAHAVMQAIHAEGEYEPSQPEFWREVDAVLKERLPHRFKAAARPGVAATVAGAGRAAVGARAGEVDGVPALVLETARQAGMNVNDPAVRKDLARYVKESQASRGGSR